MTGKVGAPRPHGTLEARCHTPTGWAGRPGLNVKTTLVLVGPTREALLHGEAWLWPDTVNRECPGLSLPTDPPLAPALS